MLELKLRDAEAEERAAANREKAIANLRPFQKGVSGNPRGRPKKDLDLAAMAQEHAREAIATLVKIMNDDTATPAARVTAASEILDRGFGRAPQTIEAKMSISDEFEQLIRSLNAKPAVPMIAHVVEGEILDAAE